MQMSIQTNKILLQNQNFKDLICCFNCHVAVIVKTSLTLFIILPAVVVCFVFGGLPTNFT